MTKGHGTGKLRFVRFNEISLYLGSFPYILLILGRKILLILPRSLLDRVPLYRGSTVGGW